MKKKIYIIIGITVFLVAAIFATREIIKNIQIAEEERQLEEKVKIAVENLSDEAKNALNYDELLADIKAKKNGKDFIYAKIPQEEIDSYDENTVSGRLNKRYMISSNIHYGNGYYYREESGGEVISDVFYSSIDNKAVLYHKNHYFPIMEYKEENNISLDSYEVAAVVIVIIGLISCIIVYKKNKKEQSK